MAESLIKLHLSRGDTAVERNAERARIGARELTREGTLVRFLRSIFTSEDETCFVLLWAEAAEAAGEAPRRAARQFERIAEAVEADEWHTIRKERS